MTKPALLGRIQVVQGVLGGLGVHRLQEVHHCHQVHGVLVLHAVPSCQLLLGDLADLFVQHFL